MDTDHRYRPTPDGLRFTHHIMTRGRPPRLTDDMVDDIVNKATHSTSWNNLAPRVGLNPDVLDQWRRLGNKVLAYEGKVARGVRIEPEYRMKVTAHGKRCAVLVTRLNTAIAELRDKIETTIIQAATVGSTETTMEVTQHYIDGKVVSLSKHREKVIPPDARIALEIAGRQFKGWQQRQEISGPEGAPIPIEASVDSVLRLISSVRDAKALPAADDVIDVEGFDVEDALLAELDELEEG